MSLHEQMNASANGEIAAIHADAARKISAIVSSSEKEAQRHLEETKRRADRSYAQQLGTAKAEAKAGARLEMAHAFESLTDELTGKIYRILDSRWRAAFTAHAAAAIAHGSAVMNEKEVDAEFPAVYKDLFAAQETALRAALEEQSVILRDILFTLQGRGGVIVRSADGRRMMTSTFEESVRRIEDEMRAECAQRFGYEQT